MPDRLASSERVEGDVKLGAFRWSPGSRHAAATRHARVKIATFFGIIDRASESSQLRSHDRCSRVELDERNLLVCFPASESQREAATRQARVKTVGNLHYY